MRERDCSSMRARQRGLRTRFPVAIAPVSLTISNASRMKLSRHCVAEPYSGAVLCFPASGPRLLHALPKGATWRSGMAETRAHAARTIPRGVIECQEGPDTAATNMSGTVVQ